jgi:AcrR family transcriptional regulator
VSLSTGTSDDKRGRLLEAALATFVRFGYRKTSMDEVARAANVSRQTLYLHFATKEDLFRAAVAHAMEVGLDLAARSLRDTPAQSIEQKLAGAFDAWFGRYIGMVGADVSDLEEIGHALVGPLFAESEKRFGEMIGKAIRGSGLPAAYKPGGISARQLADMLCATARGLKHQCSTRAEFGERFGVAVRAICMPLKEHVERS